jgi:hypothetical protein
VHCSVLQIVSSDTSMAPSSRSRSPSPAGGAARPTPGAPRPSSPAPSRSTASPPSTPSRSLSLPQPPRAPPQVKICKKKKEDLPDWLRFSPSSSEDWSSARGRNIRSSSGASFAVVVQNKGKPPLDASVSGSGRRSPTPPAAPDGGFMADARQASVNAEPARQ